MSGSDVEYNQYLYVPLPLSALLDMSKPCHDLTYKWTEEWQSSALLSHQSHHYDEPRFNSLANTHVAPSCVATLSAATDCPYTLLSLLLAAHCCLAADCA